MAELDSERAQISHLLRRFGLGASERELDFYGSDGYEKAVERLLASDEHAETVQIPEALLKNQDGVIIQNPVLSQTHWYAEQIVTNRPLSAKMALFWHDHFATSAQKVTSGPCMLNHLHMLRDRALGSFSELLTAVSQDPAMLFWLDNQDNIARRPNENFAREVMELFTLGEGHYSETDVREVARAFTGWTYGFRRGERLVPSRGQIPRQNTEYFMDRRNHDSGEKTVLGNRGPWTGEDVIGILVAHPQTSRYITEKIWRWFVEPNPDRATIDRFADRFRSSGHNIKYLLREIMLSPDFRSEHVRRSVVKNPYDFCIPMMRQLGLSAAMATAIEALTESSTPAEVRRSVGPATIALRATKTMGMELMMPPDVDGWTSNLAWISTATMLSRIQWGQQLFVGRDGRTANAYPAFPVFGGGSPEEVTARVMNVFDAELPSEKQATIASAVRDVTPIITRRNANLACATVTQLLCSTPEFQFN